MMCFLATSVQRCRVDRQRMRGDRGSAVVEVAILTPVFLLLMGFVVFAGRVGSLDQVVYSAARDGARAASLRGAPSSAVTAAEAAVAATLADHDVSCQNPTVGVDVSDLRPGGSVTVTVRCEVSLSGLSGFPLAGDKALSARNIQPIDRYRAGP